MSERIQVPAIFTGFSSRADGGATMRFATNELTESDFGLLKRMHNSFGYVLFAPNEFKEEDLPVSEASDESKSPSQRLRAVLFILWRQKGGKGEFESYYRNMMQQFIDDVKKILD